MKFLDVPALNEVTQFLEMLNTGDRILRGRVEAYSCKIAGDDKKTHKELEAQYEKELNLVSTFIPSVQHNCEIGQDFASVSKQSVECITPIIQKKRRSSSIALDRPRSDSSTSGSGCGSPVNNMSGDYSSVGNMANANTRRLLINLICTMNATFPDYDFKTLGPDRFKRQSISLVINSVNSWLSEMVEQGNGGNFLEKLWGAIDSEIILKKCEVFSYLPDGEDDPFNIAGSIWSFNYFFYSHSERKIVFLTCCCLSALQAAAGKGEDLYGVPTEEDANSEEEDASDTVSQGQDGDLLEYGLDDDGIMEIDDE